MPEESGHMAAPGPRQHRRRRVLVRASFAALAVLLLAAAAAIVVLTLLRPRAPTTELLSATATGAVPRFTGLPTISIQLNVTFLLVVRVRNPNAASFSFRPGDAPGSSGSTARLYYRGAPVGEAAVPSGVVPSRGEATLRMDMTVQGEKVVAAAGLGALVGDVLAGEMEFEARTDVKGRVTFLGFVKRSAEARSVCRIVVGVVDVKVRRQECHTDL